MSHGIYFLYMQHLVFPNETQSPPSEYFMDKCDMLF